MLDQPSAKQLVSRGCQQGQLTDNDLDSTIFNLLLPPGAVLRLDQDDSHDGLGGFHDSVHFQHKGQERTAYYSANVFSAEIAEWAGQRNSRV